MSLHARRKIIENAVAALAPLVSDSVVTAVRAGRQAPMPVAEAPFLLVYGRSERSAPLTMRGSRRKIERELTLAVEIVLTTADDEDEGLDAIAVEIEVALMDDPTLSGFAKDLWLSATLIDGNAEGETSTRRARLEFTVSYHTTASAPDLDMLNFTQTRNSQFVPLI